MANEDGRPLPIRPNPATEQQEQPVSKTVEQKITPFDVSGGVDATGKILPVDYTKLIEQFGASPFTQDLLDRFTKVTGRRPHRFMRRGFVLSHRDLEVILDRYEKGEPFYLYTGRGPSSGSMHIGHAVPFELTKFLQEVFDVPLVIQLTDDEKFMHTSKSDATLEQFREYCTENAKDIIALGFDVKKTFIFRDTDFVGGAFYHNAVKLAKRITLNSAKATFGFNDSNNIGEFYFMAIQSATAFSSSFPFIFPPPKEAPAAPVVKEKKAKKSKHKDASQVSSHNIPCLIPCAIDQDPYFRQCREHARHLESPKPSLLHSIFLPALQGPGSKMSASIDSSAIFLTDTPNAIKKKINKYAFSGGRDTAEEQRKYGGDPTVDVAFQYLSFFLDDDDELEDLRQKYIKGELLTGEMKARCIEVVQEYVKSFQEKRVKVTDEVCEEFFKHRKLEYNGNPNPKKAEVAVKETKTANEEVKN